MRFAYLVIANLLISPVSLAASIHKVSDEALRQKAMELAQKSIIVDGHIDFPYKLSHYPENIAERTQKGDFDFVRAKQGGLNAPFAAIYIPAEYQKGGAYLRAKELIKLVDTIAKEYPEQFQVARTPKEIRKNFKKGIVSFALGMENGAPLGKDLKNLQEFYDLGIRYITLTHSKWNQISDSSYDSDKHWGGLSPFGKKVVQEMNRLGMMVDVSHLSDQAFWDVIKTTKAPAIASHSSCRDLIDENFERNMSDKMIQELAKNGGVIMINFGSYFLTKEAYDFETRLFKKTKGLPQAKKDHIYKKARRKYPYATLEDVVKHIDHVVKLTGINHVGLGSDFDGVGDSLPVGLKDVSQIPNLIYELLKRGYSEEDIRKISGENLLRVWQKNIQVARRLR